MSEKAEKIESRVPGEQTIRGDPDLIHEIAQSGSLEMREFSDTPVIKITRQESTFTKGDLKMETLLVTEDVANGTTTKKIITVTTSNVPNEVETEATSVIKETENHASDGSQRVVNKVTRIPKLNFKHAVEKIKKEEKMIKDGKDEARRALKVIETMQKTKDGSQLQQTDNTESVREESPKVEDEFDKIYDEICDSPMSSTFPSLEDNEDTYKLDTKFEEIIQAYDEERTYTSIEKVKSKIPLLKRKSEQEIDVKKPTVRKNSLKKTYSVDDAKCIVRNLPVPSTNERHDVKIQSENVSIKNVTVSSTVSTSSKTILTQKSYESVSGTETSVTSQKSLKSKIPMHCKKTSDKGSENQLTEMSSQSAVEKTDRNETEKPETINKGDFKVTLNIKENSSKVETKPIITETTKTLVGTNSIQTETHHSVVRTGSSSEVNIKQQTSTELTPTTKKDLNNVVVTVPQNDDINCKSDQNKYQTQMSSEIIYNETIHVNKVNIQMETDRIVKNKEKSNGEDLNTFDCNLTDTKQSQKEISSKIFEEPSNNHKIDVISQVERRTGVKDDNKLTNLISRDEHTHKTLNTKFEDNENSSSTSVNKSFHIENKTVENIEVKNNELKETLRVSSLLYSKSLNETSFSKDNSNISQNVLNNVSKDIPKDRDETKVVNSKQETAYEDNKESNIICDENVIREGIKSNNESTRHIEESPSLITQHDDLKVVKEVDSNMVAKRSNHETHTNTLYQEFNGIIRKSESIEKNSSLITTEATDTNLNSTKQQKISKEEEKPKVTNEEQSNKVKNNDNETKTEINNNNTEEIGLNMTDYMKNIQNNSSQNLEDLEEEEIIILKGKVNRIRKRLYSKEYVKKREVEDVPRDVSVHNKIALFEQSKVNIDKEDSNERIKEEEINPNKPKIVDEVLKTDNEADRNIDSKYSYNKFLDNKNVKREITSNVKTKIKSATAFEEIYKYNINLNNYKENNVLQREEKKEVNEDIIREYKINNEIVLEKRRVKSLADLEYDGVRGKVRQMVVRMNSIDRLALERRGREERRMRQGSVSERIALFEKKVSPTRTESVNNAGAAKREEITAELSEEELTEKIKELSRAKEDYGSYEKMTYIELSDGSRLPSIALGTALLDVQLIKPVIKAAIDLGYRAVDTAYIYGNERAVGEAIREKIDDGTVRREEMFIISKLWSTSHRRDLVPRACRQSLDAMQLDYFDLYLIHNPMSFKEGSNPLPKIANVLQYSQHDYLDAWFGIEGLIKGGLVKRGGLSNFNSVQVQRVLDKGKIKPVINQVECHPYLSQSRLRDFLAPRGVSLSCYGVLGSSGTPSRLRSSLPPVIADPLVRTMAAGLGVTPSQLLIGYQLQQGRGVVVKASSARHLSDNLLALGLRLEPAHLAGLGALNRNKRTFAFQGMGDTHKNYPFRIPF